MHTHKGNCIDLRKTTTGSRRDPPVNFEVITTKIIDLKKRFITLMRAKSPLSVLETHEEKRGIAFIQAIGKETNREVIVWSFTEGMTCKDSEGNDQVLAQEDPIAVLDEVKTSYTNGTGKIFVLLDYDPYLKDKPNVIRKVRDLAYSLQNTRKSVVFISPKFPIPETLTKNISVFDLPLPARDEIEARIAQVISEIGSQITGYRARAEESGAPAEVKARLKDLVDLEKRVYSVWDNNRARVVDAFTGLTDQEVEDTASQMLVNGEISIPYILQTKKQIIRKNKNIEYIETGLNLSNVGGLKNLKNYATRAGKMYSAEARKFGVKPPKAILLVGASGTGKSLFVKAFAAAMDQPLLRLDLATAKSKWVGESKSNLSGGLKGAQAVNPAVLWVDEIDKSVSQSGDRHEVSSGMLGILLTFMEENSGLTFIATCNDPYGLPPELLTRFTKIFSVDLPSYSERIEVFSIQIAAIPRDPSTIDLPAIAGASPGYSGREIRDIVLESLSVAYDRGEDLTTAILLEQIRKVKPVSIKKAAETQRIRDWSTQYAEPASEPDPDKATPGPAVRSLEL